MLFPIEYQEKWGIFFKKEAKNIIKWGFSSTQSREIIVLFDRDANTFRIYPMKKVLNKSSDDIVFSVKGNVDIGECILLQRKGGNGSMSRTIPKTDIKHPGNNIQLKLKVNKFVVLMRDYIIGQYII